MKFLFDQSADFRLIPHLQNLGHDVQQQLAHAGVIFFRLPGAGLQTKIEHLNSVLSEHADDLERGEFLVVTPGQIRVAGRPRA